jgi:hypothetical protein
MKLFQKLKFWNGLKLILWGGLERQDVFLAGSV